MDGYYSGTVQISDTVDKGERHRMKMKRMWSFLTVVALVLATAGTASALRFTAPSYNVELLERDPGLVLYCGPILTGPITYDFGLGESRAVDLFRVGTDQMWSNRNDRRLQNVGVTFDFSNSDSLTGPDIFGRSRGDSFWFSSWGHVERENPVFFEFGRDGKFPIDLSDGRFRTADWSTVTATFTYKTDPLGSSDTSGDTGSPVPEPSTILLVGAGLIGLAGLGRKRFMH